MMKKNQEYVLDTKKTTSRKTTWMIFSLGLIICLTFPGFAAGRVPEKKAGGEQTGTIKLEDIEFRLSPLEPKRENRFHLFIGTDKNLTLPNTSVPAIEKIDPIPPQILDGKSKRSYRIGNSLYTASLLTLTALNIADYFSTIKALKLPGLQEGNPIMRPFTKNILLFSAVKLGVASLDYYLLRNIYKKNKTLGWALSIVGNVVMSWVVSSNFRKIRSVTRRF